MPEIAMTAESPFRRPALDAAAPLDDLLALLDLVYQSAESPARLDEALGLLADLVGASSVLLLGERDGARRLVAAARAASARGAAARPHALRSDAVRTLPLAGSLELVVHAGDLDPARELLLLRLAPHLGRALRLGERCAGGAAEEQHAAARLERLPLAVVLLDAKGEVVTLNDAARHLLAPAAALAVEAHRLELRHGVSRLLFEALLERIAAPPDPERRFVGGRLALADPTWGRIDLVVAPYAARGAQRAARAAVVLSARGAAPAPEERFAEAYGLTAEEAHAAVEIVAGRAPAPEGGGATAAQLRALYAKLGSTRQADLLALLLRPPGVVFESPASRARSI